EQDEFLGPTVIIHNYIHLDKRIYKENYLLHASWTQEQIIIYDVNLINNDNIDLLYNKIINYSKTQYMNKELITVDIVTTRDGIGMLPHKLYKKLDEYGIYTQIRIALVQIPNWNIDMIVKICVKKGTKYTIWESI